MKEHSDAMVCFNLFYVDQSGNVKRPADQLGISRLTYYNRVKSFARAVAEPEEGARHRHGQHGAGGRRLSVKERLDILVRDMPYTLGENSLSFGSLKN